MESHSKASFNSRAFVTLTAALSGLGLPFTGYFNHLFQMDMMTVQRHAWMTAHNILGIIFLISGVWHVILNRRALLKHAKGIAIRFPFISREAILALSVIFITLFLFVSHAFHVH